jgi:hypothetical protein
MVALSHYGFQGLQCVRHDSINAKVDQLVHIGGIVNGPYVNVQPDFVSVVYQLLGC